MFLLTFQEFFQLQEDVVPLVFGGDRAVDWSAHQGHCAGFLKPFLKDKAGNELVLSPFWPAIDPDRQTVWTDYAAYPNLLPSGFDTRTKHCPAWGSPEVDESQLYESFAGVLRFAVNALLWHLNVKTEAP